MFFGKRSWARGARTAAATIALLGIMGAAAPATRATDFGPNVYGLTVSNRLVTFSDQRPGQLMANVALSPLASGERMLGIDMRPSNRVLYGVSSKNRLYTIDPGSGAVQQVGADFAIPLYYTDNIGVDFNPQADRLRIVTDAGLNLRINPDTGAVVDTDNNAANGIQPDGLLAFDAQDPNALRKPRIVAAGYTNNVANAPSTVLYDIEAEFDLLAKQDPPNSGTLKTVASLQTSRLASFTGFDIFTSGGSDYARGVVTGPLQRVATYVTVDLTGGKVKWIDRVKGDAVLDIAVDLATVK